MNDLPANAATVATGAFAATSVGTYLAQANTIVSILAGLVAIVAGLYAIRHYRRTHKKP